jgi:hypothetical protein
MTTSLARQDRKNIDNIISAATKLLNNQDILSFEQIGGGRNSQVYRLIGADYKRVLKVYFHHASDPRDRLRTEYKSLQFLWRNGVHEVPQPQGIDWEAGCALYEYIAGTGIRSEEIVEEDIDTAVDFLVKLMNLRTQKEAFCLSTASEACFSLHDIVDSIKRRLELFNERCDGEPYNHLFRFIDNQVVPLFEEVIGWIRTRSKEPFTVELKASHRTLSPSDFGFHNALRRDNGQIAFLDFEYFGWDDPAKMIVDMVLHPGMDWSETLKKRFVRGILPHFSNDAGLPERVVSVYPLFGIKWCMILLNEFLPAHLLRRQFAGIGCKEQFTLQMNQLEKAKRMLQTVSETFMCFPYFS